MGTVRYTVVDGEVLSELRGGVKRDYVPDPLGSTVALLDSTQTITDTFSYWPYGESAGRTGTTPTPFQYVGSFGYYQDGATRNYVRARYLDKNKGRWITDDPLHLIQSENITQYCNSDPIGARDPSGLQGVKEKQICDQNKPISSIGRDDGLGGIICYQGKPIACNWYVGPSKCLSAAIDRHEGFHKNSALCFDKGTYECKNGKRMFQLDECDAHHIGFKALLGCCDKEKGRAQVDCKEKGMKSACQAGRANCRQVGLKWKFEQECLRRGY